MKNFHASIGIVKKLKIRNSRNETKTVVNHVFDQALVSRIYKKLV